MAFPSSPSNGDLHTEFGRTFKYSSASNSWSVATPDAPVDNTPTTQAYVDVASLPLADVIAGSKAFVEDGNRLFIFTGSGWFEIATINTAPTITQGVDASYTLNSDGTPTVITLQATDPEGTPIIWGYQVTSGSLEDTTVTNVGGQFTITPGSVAATFDLSFTASDGVNIDTSASSFTLQFGVNWTSQSLLYTFDNPNVSTNQVANDYFGNSVALSDTHCVVGAWYEDNTSPARLNDGKAYIYSLATGQLLYTLDNPNPTPAANSEQFGVKVAIDGNYAAITGNDAGAGMVFIYDVTTGSLFRTISNTFTSSGNFGYGLKIVGDYIFIGNAAANNAAGAVYVYSISTGTLIKTITNPGDVTNQIFGQALDVYGNYMVTGGLANSGAGKAWLYKTDTGDWTDTYHVWTKDNPNVVTNDATDYFGYAVAINDSYVAIAAQEENDPNDTARNAGRVYIYNLAGTLQRELSNPVTSGYAKLGYGLSIDGDNLLVTDPYVTVNGYPSAGQAYIFDITDGTLVTTFVNPNAYGTPNNDQFGGTANGNVSGGGAIKGGYVAISAPQESTDAQIYNSGKVYIFQAG